MSELRDRLERLAGRGSPRGADDVLQAAVRGVPASEVDIVPDDNGPDLPIIDDDAPFVVTDVEAEPHQRGRYGTLVATFGVAALVGVGALAIASVFGNGGAASPEGAVRQLADAISHKDPLAAVDVLSPTEVRSMRESVNNVTHRAADLKIVNDASAPLAGVDLSVDHLALSTQPLADGYTKVTITAGEISASTHAAAMSKLLQDALRHSDAANSEAKVELAKLAASEDLPTFVVTVRHDGRWYVSPAYTALEYAREINGGPAADFGSAKAATNLGADTPENAVSDALHAWQAGDWNRLMALAPPDELPVYDYRAWLNQVGAENEPHFTIDKLTTSATVNGDAATVKLDASGTTDAGTDNAGRWQVGGTCPNSATDPYLYGADTSDGALSQLYSDGGPEICVAGDLGNIVPFGLIPFGSSDATAAPSGSVSISVVRENGRWFVSPVTTVLKALDAGIDHVDQRTVYSFLGLAYELPPDGNITLGQPFTVPSGRGFLSESVFAFDGTKGQKVIGEAAGSNGYPSGQIYTAAGKQVDYLDFATVHDGFAYAVTLPETGSYRLVIGGSSGSNAKLTLWDAKDAPKGLTAHGGGNSNETCTSTIGGGESCSSSFSSAAPAPVPTGNNVSACVVKNQTISCPGISSMQLCKTNDASETGCLSPAAAQRLTGGAALPTPTTGPAPGGNAGTKSVTATSGVSSTTPATSSP